MNPDENDPGADLAAEAVDAEERGEPTPLPGQRPRDSGCLDPYGLRHRMGGAPNLWLDAYRWIPGDPT